jgi:hypothetical protein
MHLAIGLLDDRKRAVLADRSYTQMLWMGLRAKAAYLPG